MSKKIQKTGELRKELASLLEEIRSGDADLEAAALVCKTAGRINESLFAEAAVMGRQHALDQEVKAFGDLALHAGEGNGG